MTKKVKQMTALCETNSVVRMAKSKASVDTMA